MFERFGDAARRTVVLAQEQARRLRHDHIGTEHLLLGLLDEDTTAARIPMEMEVRPADVRQRVVEVVGKGRRRAPGHIRFTPRAKRSLKIAAERSLGASHPSPEYASTRAFYGALGYQGLEEYPADTLWPDDPCSVMVEHLGCTA
jgi:ATP-dependent Clp protease ATP-binding subunit ClpA